MIKTVQGNCAQSTMEDLQRLEVGGEPTEETEPNSGESESQPQSKRPKRSKRAAAPEFNQKNAFYKS